MADSYLSIAAIAGDQFMKERMYAAVTQQSHLGNADTGAYNAITWVDVNAYLWASSPGWGDKWKYALDSNASNPEYEPGKDEAVITDGDILATVQALAAAPGQSEG